MAINFVQFSSNQSALQTVPAIKKRINYDKAQQTQEERHFLLLKRNIKQCLMLGKFIGGHEHPQQGNMYQMGISGP